MTAEQTTLLRKILDEELERTHDAACDAREDGRKNWKEYVQKLIILQLALVAEGLVTNC